MKTSMAFSPCNITGFFRIYSDAHDPLRAGSTGASLALATGVISRVVLRKASRTRIIATFNGQTLGKNSVSDHVARRYVDLEGSGWRISVAHTSKLPTGCGYGTSGAGALGLALALNEAMGLSQSREEVAQIAHVSEIACKTGLGTVASVFSGGLSLRTVPGAPGIGDVTSVRLPRTLRVLSTTFGTMPTDRALENAGLRTRVNECSKDKVKRLGEVRSHLCFLELSRKFSECLDIMSGKLKRAISRLDLLGFSSSMAMIGQTLFTVVSQTDVDRVTTAIRKERTRVHISSIANAGAHVL